MKTEAPDGSLVTEMAAARTLRRTEREFLLPEVIVRALVSEV
jgi:hypothetical protein